MKSVAAALVAFLAAAVLFTHTGTSQARRIAGPPPQAQPACVDNAQLAIDGAYDSNWGKLSLRREGNRISGRYECCGGGTIEGTITGNVIRYRWTQPAGSGLGVWVLASTGELIGTWGVGDEVSGGGWNLNRIGSVAAQAK